MPEKRNQEGSGSRDWDIRTFEQLPGGFEGMCDNCFWNVEFHCENVGCRVCPGEFHTCLEYLGVLKEARL